MNVCGWCRSAFLSLVVLALAIPAAAAEDPVHVVLFGSMDAGPSAFATAGAKIGLDDLNREGFAALVSLGGGVRLERGPAVAASAPPILVRTTLIGAALGGYQFFYDWGVIGLFAGPEASFEALIGSPGLLALPTRIGLRVQGEVWARPSENTLATLTLILGSAREDVYGRFSAGYRVWGAYFGPETAYYGDRTGYQKWNLGLHATDFSFGRFSLRASGGWQYEVETRRSAPYFALAAWAPL